ncbi:MAG: peptidoglycan bridge formation glycyltransferase FemA/FemB family protein [Chloroflexota bacterium]|nr:peptidoglycan bridge formation glycyltransferase FemA/FemB family protein [Chloroflexota bacterium]MDE3192749.1 peptidoglycan bridge formation glycyltransferase FemA/FemB family protein [Chloroflexota bacterium]
MSAPDGWDDAAVRSPGGHVLQSSAWARIRAEQGWRPEFVRVGEPLPVALVLWKRFPVFGEVGYAPRGPVVAPGDRDGLAHALDTLAALARERRALLVKVDPELTTEEAAAPLAHAGYRRGPDVQPVLATLVIDLDRDEDGLLAGLEKDTRWSVRQAAKRGVAVRACADEASLRAFYDVYRATGERAKFITRTWEYYRLVWRTLIDAGLATLRLAYQEERPVAGAMTWACGEREVYMYGASTAEGRRCYASYGLQWECIRAAKTRGRRTYDLGGIPVDPSNKADPMHGPYLFKKGFGGEVRRYVGAHDAAPSALRYRAFVAAEPLYTRALQAIGR